MSAFTMSKIPQAASLLASRGQINTAGAVRWLTTTQSSHSKSVSDNDQNREKAVEEKAHAAAKQTSTKTQAQLDEELRQKMSNMAGEGGASGVEYEDGQPVAMKRSVKNNMFRYI